MSDDIDDDKTATNEGSNKGPKFDSLDEVPELKHALAALREQLISREDEALETANIAAATIKRTIMTLGKTPSLYHRFVKEVADVPGRSLWIQIVRYTLQYSNDALQERESLKDKNKYIAGTLAYMDAKYRPIVDPSINDILEWIKDRGGVEHLYSLYRRANRESEALKKAERERELDDARIGREIRLRRDLEQEAKKKSMTVEQWKKEKERLEQAEKEKERLLAIEGAKLRLAANGAALNIQVDQKWNWSILIVKDGELIKFRDIDVARVIEPLLVIE